MGSNLHSNGRIAVIRGNLLTQESLDRLLDCNDLTSAFSVLEHNGYSKEYLKSVDFDRALSIELSKAVDVFLDVCMDKHVEYVFMTKLNFHNARALLKLKFAESNDSGLMLYDNKAILKEEISKFIGGIDSQFDSKLKQAIKFVLESDFKDNPREIDIALDRAMYKAILESVKKVRSRTLKRYIKAEIDFNNILAIFRSRNIGFDLEETKKSFIDGGSISIKKLLANMDKTEVDFLQSISTFYPTVFTKTAKINKEFSLVELERLFDNFLLKLFNAKKNNFTGLEPFVGYYLGKLTEINAVKLVLIAIKHNLDKEFLKQRLRNLYVV